MKISKNSIRRSNNLVEHLHSNYLVSFLGRKPLQLNPATPSRTWMVEDLRNAIGGISSMSPEGTYS